jgi:hypothetical protein
MEQKPAMTKENVARRAYFNDYNKRPEIKEKRRLARLAKKEIEKEQGAKLYEASNIKVLMSLKEYTELDKEKKKL